MANTPHEEAGAQTAPTPNPEMSPQDVAPAQAAVAPSEGQQTDPLAILKEAGITKYSSKEEAVQGLRHLNSLVGDQTVATQRKIADALKEQTGMSDTELADALAQGGLVPVQPDTVPNPVPKETKQALERTARLEVSDFVREHPEAVPLKDKLTQLSIKTGKPVSELWNDEYALVFEAGRGAGSKKLQSTVAEQPLKAHGATETVKTSVDFSNPVDPVVKKMSAEEMRKHLPIAR